MNRPLGEIDSASAPDQATTPRPAPQVFVRAISTPPGPPWEQARSARLDAQHGAPLPASQLMYQVRRLERWAPSRPGRYGAFYIRAQEFREPFEASVDVDGLAVRVRFGGGGDQPQLRALGAGFGLLVVVGAILGTGGMLAIGARREATSQLEAEEQLAAARLKTAQAVRNRANQARELHSLLGQSQPVTRVLSDLNWLATSKAPEARIVGVHWERGLLAVEARGEKPPFLAGDRIIERSEKPLRQGVWLWGVGSASETATSARSLAAEIDP